MATESPPPRYTRFDGFELDRRTGRLTRGGAAVALPEQALQVLAALLDDPGEPVSRDCLQDLLWPGDTAGDFDNKLNGVVGKLRNALGDDAESPRYIETLPRRGYRFIEPIESYGDTSSRTGRRPQRVLRVAMIGGAALVVMFLLADIIDAPGDSVRPLPRLAVLPLEDRSADGAGHLTARNVTAELTHQLARLDPSALVVLGPETGRRLRDDPASHQAPDYTLTGWIERRGQGIRLAVQLTRTAVGEVLWAEAFESDVNDILVVHRDVASQVARRLRVALVPDNRAPQSIPQGAMDAYWRGRFLWADGGPAQVRKSIPLFERALAEAPEFPEALVGLADAYNTLALVGGILPRAGFDSARTYARRALEMDERLASAHAALGLSLYLGEWSWREAEQVLRRAVRLQPGRAEPHAYLASIYSIQRRHDGAIVESRLATRHDPLAPAVNGDLAWYYYYAGRYDEAVRQVEHARTLDADAPGLDLCLVLTELAAGREANALPAIRRFVLARDGDAVAASVDSVAGADGATAAWHWWLQRVVERAKRTEGSVGYLLAIGAAALGDTAAAMQTLELASSARVSWAPFLDVDPAFASLRHTDAFRRLKREMGLN